MTLKEMLKRATELVARKEIVELRIRCLQARIVYRIGIDSYREYHPTEAESKAIADILLENAKAELERIDAELEPFYRLVPPPTWKDETDD